MMPSTCKDGSGKAIYALGAARLCAEGQARRVLAHLLVDVVSHDVGEVVVHNELLSFRMDSSLPVMLTAQLSNDSQNMAVEPMWKCSPSCHIPSASMCLSNLKHNKGRAAPN